MHSVLGSSQRKWVLALIEQREDGNYYLEDNTISVKVSFAQLEYVEPDAFFTEMCILLCEGKYENGMFYLLRVLHPPLHANKSFKYKLNEQDYFGSYMQMTETMNMQFKNQSASNAIGGEIQTSMNEIKEGNENDSLS